MKSVLLALILFVVSLTVMAQAERPYTKVEMARWTALCCSLAKCIPHTYKDYNVNAQNCNGFDWAEMDFKDKDNPKPLTLIDSKNQAIGNYPYYSIEFRKPQDSLDAADNKLAILVNECVVDGKVDADKLRAAGIFESKTRAGNVLTIAIKANAIVDQSKQYYIGSRPIDLQIPGSSFSYLYLFPAGKEVLNESGDGESGTDAEAFYKDKVLVIVGARPKVISDPVSGKQSWKQDRIFPTDKASEVLIQPIKNIWVEITGDEPDVRALLKLVDWNGLHSLIGK